MNFNWNGESFLNQIANIDKSQPVFVYCLSGGRSASAANKMRSLGFTKVFELDGGMMKWRASNFPETKTINDKSKELTRAQFNDFLRSDKLVLIDFYADWCIPCQKMKPYLEEIAKEKANTVTVVRINADENPSLCKELSVDALPVLQIYKNNVLTWSNKGFITKAELVEKLK